MHDPTKPTKDTKDTDVRLKLVGHTYMWIKFSLFPVNDMLMRTDIVASVIQYCTHGTNEDSTMQYIRQA